jgi:phosphatidate cytidylyltransferase
MLRAVPVTTAGNPAWRDLRVRVISAVILIPLSVAAVGLGGWIWKFWLGVFVGGLAAEWVKLCKADPLGYGFVPVLLLSGYGTTRVTTVLGLSEVLFSALIVALCYWRLALGLGVLYICPAFVSLLLMRSAHGGFRDVLFVVVVVWGTDIGAYLVGRLIGGPPLAPRISPGKTWSGSVGGLVAASLVGAAAGYEHPLTAGLLAFLLSVIAQAGDLLESAIKRHFGVKDSGNIIPGHGGLLDRLDGLLTAAPAAMLWSALVTPHAMLWMVPL